jgi:hypothetical protein
VVVVRLRGGIEEEDVFAARGGRGFVVILGVLGQVRFITLGSSIFR